MKKITSIFIIYILLNSCGLKVVDNHGQIYDNNLSLETFIEGKTTKEEITNLLGSPSTVSSFDGGKSWFYISSEFKKFAFLDGVNTDQKILVFEFKENTLNKKIILSKNNMNEIEFEDSITDSSGRKVVWYKQFLQNLNPDPFGANNSNKRED